MKRMHADVAGVQVTYYELVGDGPMTVLFLHGVGGTGKMWAGQMRHLREYGRMLAVDLPGYAGGGVPETIRSLSDYAPLLLGLLDQLEVKEAVWVGNSLGGRISVEAALLAPERVAGLGLICSAGIRLPEAEVVAPQSVSPEEFDARVFYRPERFVSVRSEAGQQATLAARALYEQMVALTERMDFQDRLHEIQVPTRVIWGRHDGVIPLAVGEAFAIGIRGAKLTVIEQVAHAPHVEQPQAVNGVLEKLLEEVEFS